MSKKEEDITKDDANSYYVHTRIEKSASTETIRRGVKERSSICFNLETASSSKRQPPQITALTSDTIKHYGRRVRLYCRTGFCITILADGSVIGDPLGNHTSGVLEFSSAAIGELRIRGVESNLYLAMNRKGMLYGEEDPREYATVFIEGIYGSYNTFLSQKYAHKGWYVGIKKNGTIKRGPLTKWGQKAIQFLPMQL